VRRQNQNLKNQNPIVAERRDSEHRHCQHTEDLIAVTPAQLLSYLSRSLSLATHLHHAHCLGSAECRRLFWLDRLVGT
jgi:hypothetical protein